jgi:hypothetical protein
MSNDELNGREIFNWQNSPDPFRDLHNLAATIARLADIFTLPDGALVYLKDQQPFVLTLAALTEIIAAHLVIKRLRSVNQAYEREYAPLQPDATIVLATYRILPTYAAKSTQSAAPEMSRGARLALSNNQMPTPLHTL